jgi:RHS repeat-associated protein
VGLADSTGAIRTSYGYDPYGNTGATGTANDNSYQYAGRENDGTGLYFNRARYYDPSWGRFISQDPIGFAGGDVNLYQYVRANPISASDPIGLTKTDKWYGFTNRNFQWWLHNCYKKRGDPDVGSRGEMEEIYEEWVAAGSPPIGKCSSQDPCPDAKTVTNLALIGTIVYWTISELSRLFPPRNFVPIP